MLVYEQINVSGGVDISNSKECMCRIFVTDNDNEKR